MKTKRKNKTKISKEQGVWINAQNSSGVTAPTSLGIPFSHVLTPVPMTDFKDGSPL